MNCPHIIPGRDRELLIVVMTVILIGEFFAFKTADKLFEVGRTAVGHFNQPESEVVIIYFDEDSGNVLYQQGDIQSLEIYRQ